MFNGSGVKGLKINCWRTKAQYVLNPAIGPYAKQEFGAQLKEKLFGLHVDETQYNQKVPLEFQIVFINWLISLLPLTASLFGFVVLYTQILPNAWMNSLSSKEIQSLRRKPSVSYVEKANCSQIWSKQFNALKLSSI